MLRQWMKTKIKTKYLVITFLQSWKVVRKEETEEIMSYIFGRKHLLRRENKFE